jgi:hypothetical protein
MVSTTLSSSNVVPFLAPANRPEPEPVGFAQASKAWLEHWLIDRRLNQSEKEICVWIYIRFNTENFKETGELKAWPSWEYLMEKTGLKRRCVAKSLRRLKELGAFEVTRGPYNHKENRRGHNRYTASRSKVHQDAPSGEELGARSEELGARQGQSKVHPGVTIRGDRRGESRRGECESKVHADGPYSKDGNSRGPRGPEEESKPLLSDSDLKPSLQPACDVPRAADGGGKKEEAMDLYWGHNIGRPSKMKKALPADWRPRRTLSPFEETRLADMRVWATAHGVEMADWDAFFEIWLSKHTKGEENGKKSILAAADRLIDELGGRKAASRYAPGSSGPRPIELDSRKGATGVRGLPKR